MAEITADTSSYPRPVAQPGLLDTVGKFQQLQHGQGALEQQRIGIDQSKLKLMSDHMAIANRELSLLANDPNPTPEKVQFRLDNIAKQTDMPPQIKNQMEAEFANAKTPDQIRTQAKNNLDRGLNTEQMLHRTYGVPGGFNQGQQYQPTLQRTGEAPVPAGSPIQMQAPPTTPVVGANNEPRLLGPQAPQLPPGAVPAPGGIPGQFDTNRLPVRAVPTQSFMKPPDASAAPTAPNKIQSRLPIANDPNTVIPRGPATGLPPGVAEAQTITGAASGTELAKERQAAKSYQQDIWPIVESITWLEKLGTKGTGPGTDTINNLKSFIVSNVPGIKADDPGLSSVTDFDKAKKYLVQIARSQGTTGTNDQLAAAFSGNPSVGMSNAAATDVAKSILALRRMKQAQLIVFQRSGLTPDKFSEWAAENQNVLDPRAFGFDVMKPDARKKLVDRISKNGKELQKFEQSLKFAREADLIEPPKRQ